MNESRLREIVAGSCGIATKWGGDIPERAIHSAVNGRTLQGIDKFISKPRMEDNKNKIITQCLFAGDLNPDSRRKFGGVRIQNGVWGGEESVLAYRQHTKYIISQCL